MSAIYLDSIMEQSYWINKGCKIKNFTLQVNTVWKFPYCQVEEKKGKNWALGILTNLVSQKKQRVEPRKPSKTEKLFVCATNEHYTSKQNSKHFICPNYISILCWPFCQLHYIGNFLFNLNLSCTFSSNFYEKLGNFKQTCKLKCFYESMYSLVSLTQC